MEAATAGSRILQRGEFEDCWQASGHDLLRAAEVSSGEEGNVIAGHVLCAACPVRPAWICLGQWFGKGLESIPISQGLNAEFIADGKIAIVFSGLRVEASLNLRIKEKRWLFSRQL